MAEAACGPSNALSTFKQHTAVDRSLQQDRLNSRHLNGAPQNFRSANPNTAHLDADFEAFQAGFAPPILENPLHHQLQHTNIAVPSQPFQQACQVQQAQSWATDFQNLNISSPSASTSNWAQGFQQHIAQSAPRAQSTIQSPLAFQQQARYGLTGFQSSFTPQQTHYGAGQSKGKQPIQAEQYDEAAFERAFDMAKEDMMADVEQEQPMTQEDKDLEAMIERVEAATQQEATNMLNDVAQESEEEKYWRPEDTIHNSDVEYQPFHPPQEEPLQNDQQQQNHDDDALAATAQELLEKVSHDQSDKFKNSQFLSLMRKLADREVRVDGDKMVETTDATSATTADSTALNNASSASNIHYHDRPVGGTQRPKPFLFDERTAFGIPTHEQDLDSGRLINPEDGREVVDLLAEPGAMEEVEAMAEEDAEPEPITDDMDYDPSYAELHYALGEWDHI